MGSAVLGEAISAIRDWSVTEAKEGRAPRATEAFGSLVFNDAVQQTRLPKPVYHALRRTITHGDPLDHSVADAVASATDGSSASPWVIVRRRAWYTGFGSRVCCTESLNTRLPNASVARGARGSFASVTDQSRIALIASPKTAEPMVAPLLLE